jgi:hypothetical protein
MPNREWSPLDDIPKTIILGRWRVSLESLAGNEGQGAAEGPLELHVAVELDPVGPGNTIHMGSIGRVNAPAEPVYVIPTFNVPDREFVVKVTVVDLDGFPRMSEPAPHDKASKSARWTLVRKQDSTLSVSLRLPEVGGRPWQQAGVTVDLMATWVEDELPALEPRDPPERLPPVPKQ